MNRRSFLTANFLFVLSSFLFSQSITVELPTLFSDNMILQQNSQVPFWGKAPSGKSVSVSGSWKESANGIVADDGTFRVDLKTPSAGGPYEITLKVGGLIFTFQNVLIGEVWLCSGQSNMEMPLKGWMPNNPIEGSSEEIASSKNPNIRLFTVARAISPTPKFNVTGNWSELNSSTASEFSAPAYFFGKKLYNELKVPIGLIHSSWGGTPAEAWTSSKYLNEMSDFKSILGDISKSAESTEKLNQWLTHHQVIKLSDKTDKWKDLSFKDETCSEINFDDSFWKTMTLPVVWENTEVRNFDGVIWFRKKITIPETWVHHDLILELGPIDDMDVTFVNGKKVGSFEQDGYWQTERKYSVSKEQITSTEIMIAVRVLDTQGGGGIYGAKEKMKLSPADGSSSISLAGDWKYSAVAEVRENQFYVFDVSGKDYFSRPQLKVDVSPNSPTMLYNAMISPIIPYSIKGVIWYQGESNTGRDEQYKTLFPLMINNWRSDWNEGNFPFYFVQIAPYRYGEGTNSQRIREAQFQTLSKVENTGMVVTMDIGNVEDIHPSNKRDVGFRLANWALAKTYGKNVPYSGPLYDSMKSEGNEIILNFKFAENGLVIKERNGEHYFLIAGKDQVFKKAAVKIDGAKLILSNPEIKNPIAVRYAWSDIQEATLFNKDGLPASSFRTDNW